MSKEKTQLVHVVANKGDFGGGGFEWFYNAPDAITEFDKTVSTAPADTTVYQFSVRVPGDLDRDGITQYIEDRLPELEAKATKKVRAKWGDATSNPYHVDINQDEGFVRIARHSREMLYWETSEWQDDPETVFAILNAVNLALTNPVAMTAKLSQMGKL